jgi:hypothetical protein
MIREEDVRVGHMCREEDAHMVAVPHLRRFGFLWRLDPALTGWANLCHASGAGAGRAEMQADSLDGIGRTVWGNAMC